MIALFFIFAVIIDALGDGVQDKVVKHWFGAFHVLLWLLFPAMLFYAEQWQWFSWPGFFVGIICYTGIRYLIFDAIWNVARGQRLDYIGNTSYYGKVLRTFHPTFVLFTKVMIGGTAIFITIIFQ